MSTYECLAWITAALTGATYSMLIRDCINAEFDVRTVMRAVRKAAARRDSDA